MLRIFIGFIRKMKGERGFSLMETIIALGLLGIIATGFLGALTTAPQARFIADEKASAKALAESQMEYIKKQEYSVSYSPAPIPDEYTGYAATIDTKLLRNSSIQKITVTITHNDKKITDLESYNVSR